jgi:hypothetical protein
MPALLTPMLVVVRVKTLLDLPELQPPARESNGSSAAQRMTLRRADLPLRSACE